MWTTSILAAASLIGLVASQAQNLSTALAGQPSLSTLLEVLSQAPSVTTFLASQQNVTLFAPSNDALASIVAEGGIFSIEQAAQDPTLVEQTLRYHLLRDVVPSSDISEIPQFVPTYLNYSTVVLDNEVSGSNVTGGQVVDVALINGTATVTSGTKAVSKVTAADISFDNGVIHIIDTLLTIPLSISKTLIAGNFTALAGAATEADLVPTLQSLSDVTIFAPNNEAFQALASQPGVANISTTQLASLLQYHVIQGTVGYSTFLDNNTVLETLQGESVTVRILGDGSIFVNSARVINANVLVDNGVVHVIDQVLDPGMAGAGPSTASMNSSSVTLAPFVPFTTAVPAATSAFSDLTQSSSSVAVGTSSVSPSTSTTSATTSAGPAVQTTNAGTKNGLVAEGVMGVAVALGFVLGL